MNATDDAETRDNWEANVPLLYDMFMQYPVDGRASAVAWGHPSHLHTPPTSPKKSPLYKHTLYMAQGNLLRVADISFPRGDRVPEYKEGKTPKIAFKKSISHPGEITKIKVMPKYQHIVASLCDSLVHVWNTSLARKASESDLLLIPASLDMDSIGEMRLPSYALEWSSNSTNPSVISGGGENNIISMWSLGDYATSLSNTSMNGPSSGTSSRQTKRSRGSSSNSYLRQLRSKVQFRGHTTTINSCSFRPDDDQVFASVAADMLLLLWDARVGTKPTHRITTYHSADVTSVDWHPTVSHFLATGSLDESIQIFDLRRLPDWKNKQDLSGTTKRESSDDLMDTTSEDSKIIEGIKLKTLLGSSTVTHVEWAPEGQHLASSSDDGSLALWKVGSILSAAARRLRNNFSGRTMPSRQSSRVITPTNPSSSSMDSFPTIDSSTSQLNYNFAVHDLLPEELLFRHCGHRDALVSFQFLSHDEEDKCTDDESPTNPASRSRYGSSSSGNSLGRWNIASLSSDALQIFRPSEVFSLTTHKALARIDTILKHKG